MRLVALQDIMPEGLSHDADIMKRVLIPESALPGSVRLSHAIFKAGQKASVHSHVDLVEVFYVTSGSGHICVDGTRHTLQQGSCIRIDPGELHELVNDGTDDLTVLYFGLKAE